MVGLLERASIDLVCDWLAEVPDPEIPALSIMDLGIVREVFWDGAELAVAITPTYSGCPAVDAIRKDIEALLAARGVRKARVETRLSPAWTTDWMSSHGRAKLKEYGIAPPACSANMGPAVMRRVGAPHRPGPTCPRCASAATEQLSEFGSTACKAIWRCRSCGEPFDYFKPL